jgi:predicted nucleic acid-binding protein
VIILDTNVLSELTRPEPNQGVLNWADSVHGPEAGTTAITVAELLYGIARLPDGRRRELLDAAIHQLIDIDLGGRTYSFDVTAATHYAAIVADREAAGHPISVSDAQIAAICRSLKATLATRNTRDFQGTGVKLIDPWRAN